MPIKLTSSLETTLQFDFVTRYGVSSKERLVCLTTLEHCIKIGSLQELPIETSHVPWSTFFPVPKKGTEKMRGCIDLRRPKHIVHEHFEMEGLYTIRQLLRGNGYITKVDLSDFYMHFLIGQADRRYMRFMWEGRKFQCIGMPFGLALAMRLATKMMAPMIRYL